MYVDIIAIQMKLILRYEVQIKVVVKSPQYLSYENTEQEAQLPLRNRASAMHIFVAKLLSIAEMTYTYTFETFVR